MTILDEILEYKRGEVEAAKQRMGAAEMASEALAGDRPVRGLAAALTRSEAPAVIAELKRRSPSRGMIRPDFEPVSIAEAYASGGAAALSVLTDANFFGGELGFLSKVREAVELPLLRKDFVIDPYQIDEAKAAGADAVLLIVAALSPSELEEFAAHARSLGLDALVEVHDAAELEVALEAGATLVGVNNRDLRTFSVDLGVFEEVAAELGRDTEIILVAESGIHVPADIARLEKAGARAFLVGESLLRRTDVADALRELRRRE